ncbi:sugar ABC transporter permease, partial [Agrobacterium sp. S2]|nr:sugar ABC transporter permease [Agrobacterium sp. S2]
MAREPSTALAAVTFINIWAGYPFFMISLLAGLQGIPRDLYEAARVDGATPFQQFRNVTVPQLRPDHHLDGAAGLHLDHAAVRADLETTGGGPNQRDPRCSAPSRTSWRSAGTSS